MINRRQLIATASAFIAATRIPAMPILAEDVLGIYEKKLIIDEPIFVDLRGFREFRLENSILVFRAKGQMVISADGDVLSGKIPVGDALFEFTRTDGRHAYIISNTIFDERTFAPTQDLHYEAIHINHRARSIDKTY